MTRAMVALEMMMLNGNGIMELKESPVLERVDISRLNIYSSVLCQICLKTLNVLAIE